MVATNEAVAYWFASGQIKGQNRHLIIKGDVIYSYGDHFPIAFRDNEERVVYFNMDKYSMTTSRHQNLVRNMLESAKFRIVEVDTARLKEIIRSGSIPRMTIGKIQSEILAIVSKVELDDDDDGE